MYALKVQINNEVPIIAGAEDIELLTVAISCLEKLRSSNRQVREDQAADLLLTVGGLPSRASDVPDEHHSWVSQRALRIGDVISVEILDAHDVGLSTSGKRAGKKSDP